MRFPDWEVQIWPLYDISLPRLSCLRLSCVRARRSGTSRQPKLWVAAQVYPRSGSFRDMSGEIEVELLAFSVTVLSTAAGSEDFLALSKA